MENDWKGSISPEKNLEFVDTFVFICGLLLYNCCGLVLGPLHKEGVWRIKDNFSFDFIIAKVSLCVPEEFILERFILLTVY